MRTKLGLDLPVWEQFGAWGWRVLHGDLGISIFSNQPVTRLIGQRLEPTIALTISTTVFTVLIAVPIGVIAAWRAGTWIDRAVMSFAVLGFSFPVFVVGYILIYVLSMTLGWLPIQGYRSIANGFGPFLTHLVLPTLALGISFMALVARITRTSVLEVLNQDYIRTARSKGLAMWQVLLFHALPNAAVPIVTIIGVGIAVLIGGVVVTESVFSIPGLGRLVVDSILSRDYPVIQGVLLVFAGVYVAINLAIDLLYVVLDPRIRY
jgi:peptide/nickel transport system permease protein